MKSIASKGRLSQSLSPDGTRFNSNSQLGPQLHLSCVQRSQNQAEES